MTSGSGRSQDGSREGWLIEIRGPTLEKQAWLAYWQTYWTGEGAGKHSERSLPRLIATHHALSRLAQRSDARAVVDLLRSRQHEALGPPPFASFRSPRRCTP
jgi:hypothetical protein